MKNKILLSLGAGIASAIFTLAPKIQTYLDEQPSMKRGLEQQIQYSDSIIKNYPYQNLYLIERPEGNDWRRFLDYLEREKPKKPFVVLYSAKECISCYYAKEQFINLAKKHKNNPFFIINYCFFDGSGQVLAESLANHGLNESSFPVFVSYKDKKKTEFNFTRGDLLKLSLFLIF